MARWMLAVGFWLCFAGFGGAEEARLRAAPNASGPAITLGDLFENAGEAAKRAVAPSPAPGRSTQLTAALVANAAAAGGLTWTPPEGVEKIVVTRGAPNTSMASATAGRSGAVVRRGDVVTLTYERPGVRLVTRARATADAALGERVSLQNLQSDRSIDAIVTGVGAAVAAP